MDQQNPPAPQPPNPNDPWQWSNGADGTPGYQPPAPGYPQQGFPQQQPGFFPPQPVPPVIPFHPLTLGSLIEGTFAAIRFNPKTLFMFSMVTMLIVGVFQAIVSALSTAFTGYSSSSYLLWSDYDYFGQGTYFNWNMFWALIIGSLIASLATVIGTILVNGFLVKAVSGAVIGKKLSLAEAWQQVRPHLGALIGATLLVAAIEFGVIVVGVGLFTVVVALAVTSTGAVVPLMVLLAVVFILAMIGLTLFLMIRLYFVTILVVLENSSPTEALKRSWALTRASFWRCAGRIIVAGMVAGAVTGILTGAVTAVFLIIATVLPAVVVTFITALIQAAVIGAVAPLTATFTTLMCIDERMRQENLGPALAQAWQQELG